MTGTETQKTRAECAPCSEDDSPNNFPSTEGRVLLDPVTYVQTCTRCQRRPEREEPRRQYSLLGLVRGKGPVDPLPRSDGGDDRGQQHRREGAISRY